MLFDVKNCKIQIVRKVNPNMIGADFSNIDSEVNFTKYQIKETDFRTKTATFTTDYDVDLTTGQYAVRISSIYHENFTGVILSKEYDEGTGLINYQCQDWSRFYQSKEEHIYTNCVVFNIIRSLLTRGNYNASKSPTDAQRKSWKIYWSGLKAVGLYDQSLYSGNLVKGNPMKDKVTLITRDKSDMDLIRDLTFGRMSYVDVWFNDKGVIQIEPLSKTDWESTGLVLSANTDRSFKFDTTNTITGGVVTGDGASIGESYTSKSLINLDLSAFFGSVWSSVSGSKDSSTSSAKSVSKSTITANKKKSNPFNTKKKKVWINADNGSNAKKNDLAKALKNAGWTVHVGATDSNAHYRDYWNVTKDYSVYITLYNGFCAGTIREAYSSKIQNVLKKKGVQLVPIWDSAGWTNPHGMKPYRYGDFSKYSAKRAWDDNFSSSNPAIKNVGDYLKKNKATYCVAPSTSEIMKQFNAGGYFKYKGIKV